jgi:ComF family protein
MDVLDTALRLLYPPACVGCGTDRVVEGMPLCWDCRTTLSVITTPFCSVCGEPVFGRVDHDYVCHACSERLPWFRRSRAAIHYNEVGKRLVTQFKYAHALWLEELLAGLLETCVRTHYDPADFDVVVAVPLHPVKRRERGFNQSELLASRLARALNLSPGPRNGLLRVRMTPSQTRLTARQRLSNVLGAFAVPAGAAWAGQRVLLVDDVMTTGATVSACAAVLRKAGAVTVDVATVARGV